MNLKERAKKLKTDVPAVFLALKFLFELEPCSTPPRTFLKKGLGTPKTSIKGLSQIVF